MAESYETLSVQRGEGIVTVTLERPDKKNAINNAMWHELISVFAEVEDRADDRVLVVTGRGDGFCSGADLTDSSSGDALAGVGSSVRQMRLVGRCALALHELSTPTIAKVNGVAAGAGANLALGCDLIIAADHARFIEIFAERGLIVDFGGSWLLPRLVGLHRAKELVLLAEPVTADEAKAMGLVNRVVPAGELDDEVANVARRIASLPPTQLSISKRLLNQSYRASMAEALESEATAQSLMFRSADVIEAMLAFAEKREPTFRGE